MPISYSYTEAADRLLADAVTLWDRGRREGAAHVAGLSAECALKSILVGLGLVPVGSDGQIPRGAHTNRIRNHIDRLWAEFAASLTGHTGATYTALLPSTNPFHDWLVDHRYVAGAQLVDEQLSRWTWAALVVSRGVLAHAKQQTPPEVQ